MSEKMITPADFPKLCQKIPNLRAGFNLLHPQGLTLEQLRQKAGEHNFYRVIYQHYCKEVSGNG